MLGRNLGYGKEISILGEGGKLLYDIGFDDLLDRCLKEIGLVEGRTLTVDEELERVNLEFIITEHTDFQVPTVGTIPKKLTPKDMENGEKKRMELRRMELGRGWMGKEKGLGKIMLMMGKLEFGNGRGLLRRGCHSH